MAHQVPSSSVPTTITEATAATSRRRRCIGLWTHWLGVMTCGREGGEYGEIGAGLADASASGMPGDDGDPRRARRSSRRRGSQRAASGVDAASRESTEDAETAERGAAVTSSGRDSSPGRHRDVEAVISARSAPESSTRG